MDKNSKRRTFHDRYDDDDWSSTSTVMERPVTPPINGMGYHD